VLRLRVYYDDSATPSVDAPLGDLFAVGHGFERPVRSLMVRASSEGRSRNSYWPMPFRRSCRITVTNEGRRRVSNLYYHVDWQKLRALPEATPYFHAGADYQVGWPRLTKGRHTLTYVCLGRNAASSGHNLGVDDIVLARTGPEAWAAAAEVREPRRPSGSVAEIARALSDPDPVTRCLSAIELRARGQDALPALEPLTAALRDRDVNVRLMSANAIAAIGAPAAAAVPALAAACSVGDEDVQVLRSCATALGAIGPAAAAALPVLREIARQPRVSWAADAAIRRIGGRE
jgi:hypothetical protein